MAEDLRECKDGTITSTGQLAKELGYDDLGTEDLNDLHNALFAAAKANHITLDMPDHTGRYEGLLYNKPFTIRTRKAQIKCPRCGSIDTARYLYGYPAYTERMQKMLKERKWALGGCCISETEVNGGRLSIAPERVCNSCGKDFGTAPVLISVKKNTVEDYRDIVTSIRLSAGRYLQGSTEMTISKNENGASVRVTKLPYGEAARENRQISPAEWEMITGTLYLQMYLHEWKKRFENPGVLDGEQWHLQVKLAGRRVRNYHGSNAYPPYWPELTKLFRAYAKL